MKPPEDPQVAEWLRFAAEDRLTAHHMLPLGALEVAVFHCQQAAEKHLKAILVALDMTPPRTHDLEVLVDLCQVNGALLADVDDAAEFLSPHAFVSRYPGLAALDLGTAQRAVTAMEAICRAAEQALARGGA